MVPIGRFFLHRPPRFSFVMQPSTDSHLSSHNTLAGSANPWLDHIFPRDDLSSNLLSIRVQRFVSGSHRNPSRQTRCMAFISGHQINEPASTIRTVMHTLIGLCLHTNTRSECVRTSNNMRPLHHVSSLEINNTSLMPLISTANLRRRTHPVPYCTSSLRGPRHAGSDLARLPKSTRSNEASDALVAKDDEVHSVCRTCGLFSDGSPPAVLQALLWPRGSGMAKKNNARQPHGAGQHDQPWDAADGDVNWKNENHEDKDS